MWVLKGKTASYVLHPGSTEVGRKAGQIPIADDVSLSRSHCHFNLAPDGDLTLTDSKSKYGTFVDGTQLIGGSACLLREGAAISFGIYDSKFTLQIVELSVCFSGT